MKPVWRATIARRVFASMALLVSTVHAVPNVGDDRPALRLVDGWDRSVDLSRVGPKPMLVIYEDKGSAGQNQTFKDALAALAKGDRYKTRVSLVPVADLQGYDYWPVRGFVKDAIQEASQKFGTVIYCDWGGEARQAFGARRGVSNVILYGKDGKVLFAYEGAMPADKREEVIQLLRDEVES